MNELNDFEIRRTDELPPTGGERLAHTNTATWVVVGLLAAAAIVALYVVLRPGKALAPGSSVKVVTAPAGVTDRPLGGTPQAIDLPPLGESDVVVRSLLGALSTAPAVVTWLSGTDLVRSFVVTVANVADGTILRRLPTALRPASPFRVVERDGATYIDPANYARYDRIADAAASIDAQGAAGLYATLRPLLTTAYAELGPADSSFDHALERAIVLLIRTPVLDGPVAVRPKGGSYVFADDRVEALAPAQKLLIRMGPRNARLIQARLRAVATALGIDPGRLPTA